MHNPKTDLMIGNLMANAVPDGQWLVIYRNGSDLCTVTTMPNSETSMMLHKAAEIVRSTTPAWTLKEIT